MKTDIKIAMVLGVVLFVGLIASEKKSINLEEQEQISFCSSEQAKSVINYD